MKQIVRLLLLCLTMPFLAACDTDDDHGLSDIALIVKPSATDSVSLQSGDKQLYALQYYTNTGGRVNRLQIKSLDTEYGEQTLLDTAYAESVKEATFVYAAPQSSKETLKVRLTFTIWESEGNKTQQTRYVYVANKQLMLQEVGPIVLYMADDKADALMFNTPTQTFIHILEATDRKVDMYLEVDTLAEGGYSLSFLSGTQARFVRANSFDYASANTMAIQTVYANSVRAAKVGELQTNDIIIVGHNAQAEGILFIQNIVRQGTDNDLCLQMRFKPLQQPSSITADDTTGDNGKAGKQ